LEGRDDIEEGGLEIGKLPSLWSEGPSIVYPALGKEELFCEEGERVTRSVVQKGKVLVTIIAFLYRRLGSIGEGEGEGRYVLTMILSFPHRHCPQHVHC